MPVMNRREYIIGGTLMIGGVAGFAVKPSKPEGNAVNLKDALSSGFGNWTPIQRSLDSIPKPSAYTQSIYEQVVAGHYVSTEGRVVTLLLAYNRAQSYASQLHRPDVCYPASGFKILRQKDVDIDISSQSVDGRIIYTQRGIRSETVLFWTRIGAQFPRSLKQQRLEIFRAALSRKNLDGIVVRASTPTSATGDSGEVLSCFVQEFADSLPDAQAELLIGPVS